MRKLVFGLSAVALLGGLVLFAGAPRVQAATVIASPEAIGAFGDPPMFDSSDAYGVNAGGTVVGHARAEGAFNDAFVFTTSSHSLGDLGTIGFGRQSTAFAVNRHGTAAGTSNISDEVPNTTAVRWLPNVTGPRSLGSLGGEFGSAFAINAAGVIVGQSDVAGDRVHHAFSWDPSTSKMTDIGVLPGGANSTASGISDAGLVVGTSEVGGTGPCLADPSSTCPLTHAFTYDIHSRVTTDIGTLPGGTSSEANAIDAAGHVVGSSLVNPSPGAATTHPFEYDTATRTFTDLGFVAGTTADRATALNDDGVVVGDDLGTGGAGAWVYDPATGSLTAAADISELNGINDHGELVGAGLVPPGLDEEGNPLPGTVTGAMHTQVVLTPGAPALARATSCTGGVELNWVAPAFAGYAPSLTYRVLRNGTQVATTAGTHLQDRHGLAGDRYAIVATDAAGASAPSAATVAACADAIAGTVTSGGSPVGGIEVTVHPFGSSHVVASATTAPDGTYAVTGLVVGSYQLRFRSPSGAYVLQWNGGVPSQSAAAPVSVTGGPSAIVDASLVAAGSIDGTVTSDASPVPGIGVRAFRAGTSTVAGTTTTAADGTYDLVGLAPGPYQVQFRSGTGAYLVQWNGGAADQSGASPLTVGIGEVTVDASLQLAGTINGQVTVFDPVTGSPAAAGGMLVKVFPAASTTAVARVRTANNGTFSVGGLAPGGYVVQVSDPFGRFGGVVWFLDDGGDGVTGSRSGATVVTLVGGDIAGVFMSPGG